MKLVIAFWVTVWLICSSAAAQSYNGHGYGFFGLDTPSSGSPGDLLSAGAGGEGFVWRGLAAGGDISYVGPREEYGSGVGLLSVNGSYHFVDRAQPGRLIPFATAGYGLAFRSGTLNLWNIGGGATWWFNRHLGLRAEVRSFQWRGERFDTSLRFGMAFK